MNQSEEFIKEEIRTTLKNIFPVDDIVKYKIDLEVLTSSIIEYVCHSDQVVSENERYEYYYALLGKAVAIAQGWKRNFMPVNKEPGQTRASLEQYLEKTYGKSLSPDYSSQKNL